MTLTVVVLSTWTSVECIRIWGGWSKRAVDLASFKRSSKLALLVGICSPMERLNNNAWSNENYTAPAQKEKLIALRLHAKESLLKWNTHTFVGKRIYTPRPATTHALGHIGARATFTVSKTRTKDWTRIRVCEHVNMQLSCAVKRRIRA